MDKFFGKRTIIGEKRISGLGPGKTERVMRDTRRVHLQTNCLVRVGVGRSDGGVLSCNHQSSQRLPSHGGACDEHRRMRQENPKPRCHIEGFAGTPGRPNRAACNFLVAPSRPASRRRERGCRVWDTYCRERGSQVHSDIQYGRYDRFPQCEISVQCTAHYRGCGGSQQAIQGRGSTRDSFHMWK